MTPKEKAWSIFWNFKNIPDKWKNEKVFQNYYAKQCALIAVDEILNCIPTEILDTNGNEIYFIINDDYNFWQEVKKELQKL